MPYVKIEITRDGVTRDKKRELVAGVTKLLGDVLGKKPEHTHVVIDLVDDEN